MTADEYWTVAELRTFLKCPAPRQYRSWARIKPFFAPALRRIGTYKLYSATKVRALLEGGKDARSPMHRSDVVRALEVAAPSLGADDAPAPRPRPALVRTPAAPGVRVPLLRRLG